MARKIIPDPQAGQKIHRLTILEKVQGSRDKWRCLCECGKESVARKHHLLNDLHKSCGCYQVEVARERGLTHGQAKTSLHRIWMNIKSRTTNPKVPCYPRYGGRGISMCPEWFNSFEAFSLGVGPRVPGMTLDRINNDGNYEPGNVRWVPHRVNCQNRSRKTVVTAFGLTLQLHQWQKLTGVGSELIRDRLVNRRWLPEDTVATPPKSTRFLQMPNDSYKDSVMRRIEEFKTTQTPN
jgi:hypothetical protein